MAITAYINTIAVQASIIDGSLSTDDTTDQIGSPTLKIYDFAGTMVYSPGMTISFTDSTSGYAFSGFISDDAITPEPNGVSLVHTLNCIDGNALAARRYYAGPEWTNRYAGDIVVDLIENVLSAEGITGNYAVDTDRSVANWQEGTLNNVQVTNDLPGGVLKLALAGHVVTRTEKTATNWNAGTLTGCMTNGDTLQLNAHPSLSFSATNSTGYGTAYAYYKIWSGSYVIPNPAFMTYKVWVNSDSPAIMCGIDFVCSDGTTLRDYTDASGFMVDQNGLRAHPAADLSGFANDQWYYRYIDLVRIAGKTISSVNISFDNSTGSGFVGSNSAGTHQAYVYDVQMQDNTGAVLKSFYGNSGSLGNGVISPSLSAKVSNIGYSNVQIKGVIGYESTGTRVSPNNSMSNAGIYQSSLISWLSSVPGGTSLDVYSSVDGGATFQAATDLTPMANIPLGANVASRNVATKAVMTITGKDPTVTPQLTSITWTVTPAYAATKTDTRTKYNTQADWNTGTLSETLATSAGDLIINSVQRDWNDSQVTGQTVFGTASTGNPLQATFKLAASLRQTTGNVARSRLDFASTWQNFIMCIDVQVPAANTYVGVCYRTTYWDNLPNTEAYLVDLSTTSFNFGRGTNSVTNTHTNIQTQALTLAPGDWHTITIIANGSTHNILLDGVNYWGAVTDATFTAAGSFGLRNYDNSGGTQTVYYDNFGVMPIDGVYPGPGTFSGPTWTSPSISLGNFTAGTHLIFWDASTIDGDYLNIQASFNGGTYTNCTNGGTIPGIVSGTAYTGATLQLKVQMQAATPADTPVLHGLTAWVTSQYVSTGSRISVPLPLAPVGNAGSALMTWNGIQPPNTQIYIDNGQDGSTFTNIGSGASGSASLAGIQTQSDAVVDEFTSDTSVDYTSTCRTGGSIATWTWDTANSQLTVSGGSNAHLLYNSPTTSANVDISTVMDTSDNGGFVWGWQDQSDYYSVSFHDASSGNNPNTARLFVVSGGISTQIGGNVAISFNRGMPHIFDVQMIDTQITITMDGAMLFQVIDTTLSGVGFAGLRTDNTGGGSAANFYLLRVQFFGQDVTDMELFSQVRLISTDPTVTPSLSLLSMSVHDASIQPGVLIPQTAYSLLNNNTISVAGICDDLVKQSGNFQWRINGTQLSFQQEQCTLALWAMTDLDTVDDGNASWETIPDAYRNQQWGVGGYDVIADTRVFLGDGIRTSFDVPFPIDSISSILVGNIAQTIGIKGVDTGKQWYYTQGQTSLVQDSNASPISGTTQQLTVAYNGQANVSVCVTAPSEIAKMAARSNYTTTGIIEEPESLKGLPKLASITKCQGYLDQYAQDNYILKVSTRRSGLAPGQLLPMFLKSLKVTNGTGYLITDVKPKWHVKGIGGGATDTQADYQITAIKGPNTSSWIRFLSSLGGGK